MKLSLAVALSHNARLLILDEATSGLDPVMREECLDLFLAFMQKPENGIFFSTHITSDLDKIADRIVFIHEGKIILDKERDTLLESYGLLKCGQAELKSLDRQDYIRVRKGAFGCEVLLEDRQAFQQKHPQMQIERPKIEEIMLFFINGEIA